MIIGISGTFGSGKDTVARLIESKGFEHFSTPDLLRSETEKLGRTTDRETLRTTGNELREKFGSGFLAEKAMRMATKGNILISGVRSQGEVDFIKKHKDTYLIFVDAPIEFRYERISGRNRNVEDRASFEEFKQSEEIESDGDINSQDLSYCKDQADFIVQNDGTFEELGQKIDEILTKIGQI